MIPSTKVVPMSLLKYKTKEVTTEVYFSITYVYGHWLHVYCGTTKLY